MIIGIVPESLATQAYFAILKKGLDQYEFLRPRSSLCDILDPRDLCVLLVDSWALSQLPQSFLYREMEYKKVAKHIRMHIKTLHSAAISRGNGKTTQEYYDTLFLITHIDLARNNYGIPEKLEGRCPPGDYNRVLFFKSALKIPSYITTSDFVCEAIYSFLSINHKECDQAIKVQLERVLSFSENGFTKLKSMQERGFLHGIMLLLIGLSNLKRYFDTK